MDQKTCQQCQGPILQRPNESNYRYKQKKFCSQICSHKWMKEQKVGWYAAPAIRSAGKAKHKWDDLSIQPYLNNDEVVPDGRADSEDNY